MDGGDAGAAGRRPRGGPGGRAPRAMSRWSAAGVAGRRQRGQHRGVLRPGPVRRRRHRRPRAPGPREVPSGPISTAVTCAAGQRLHRVDPDLLEPSDHPPSRRRHARDAEYAAEPAQLAVQVGAGPPLAALPPRSPGEPGSARTSHVVGLPATPSALLRPSTGARCPRSEWHRWQAATSFSTQDGRPRARDTCSMAGRTSRSEDAASDAGVPSQRGRRSGRPARPVGPPATPRTSLPTGTALPATRPPARRRPTRWPSSA